MEIRIAKSAPEGARLVSFTEDNLPARVSDTTIVIGVGKRADMTRRKLFILARKIEILYN